MGGAVDVPVLVVHLVAVPRRVDDVQPQSHAVLRDDCSPNAPQTTATAGKASSTSD